MRLARCRIDSHCSLLSGLRMRCAWNNSSATTHSLCSSAIAKQRPAAYTTYIMNDVCCPIALRRDLPPLT